MAVPEVIGRPSSSPEKADSSTCFLKFVLPDLFLGLGVRRVGRVPCPFPRTGHPWVHLDTYVSLGSLDIDLCVNNVIGHDDCHYNFSFPGSLPPG